eukprot:Sspe_Gene.24337::Locus_9623_Transcript_1_1_Confidence_1.000_Length_2172::g.24337::m.24337
MAVTKLELQLSCSNLAICTDLVGAKPFVVVRDTAEHHTLSHDTQKRSARMEVGRTSSSEGTTCTWEDVIPVVLGFDGRRSLCFSVYDADELVGEAVIAVPQLILQERVVAKLRRPGVDGEWGELCVVGREAEEMKGEVWLAFDCPDAPEDCGSVEISRDMLQQRVVVGRTPKSFPTRCGSLHKYSTGKRGLLFQNWKERWVVISRREISYYDSRETASRGGSPNGHIPLSPFSPFIVYPNPNPSIHREVRDPHMPYFAVQCTEKGKPAPLTLLFRTSTHADRDEWAKFLTAQRVMNETSPSLWPVLCCPAVTLCGGDLDSNLNVSICTSKGRTHLGSSQTALRQILGRETIPLQSSGSECKIRHLEPKGRIFRPKPTFVDIVRSGVSIQPMLAVDFTASNGDISHQNSLHRLENGSSPYTRAIREVLGAINSYNPCETFPFYGFGARREDGKFSSLFPVGKEEWVSGADEALEAYADLLPRIGFYGPKNIVPTIEKAQELAAARASTEDGYVVLIIFTCGDLHDVSGAMHALVESASLPMSVIFVGLGQDSFNVVQKLHKAPSDSPLVSPRTGLEAVRNNVRFVRVVGPVPQIPGQPAPPGTMSAEGTMGSIHPSDIGAVFGNIWSEGSVDLPASLSALPLQVMDWYRYIDLTDTTTSNNNKPRLVL